MGLGRESLLVLAGPTLDRALGLVGLGLLDANPSQVTRLDQCRCVSSSGEIAAIADRAPDELKPLLVPRDEEPVHVYVSSERQVHRGGGVERHLCGSTFPEGSFMLLCDEVLVPSWPLYFLLRCRTTKGLSRQLMLGMELCGSYAHLVVGDDSTPLFFRVPTRGSDGKLKCYWNSPKLKPAVTVDELRSFVDSAAGIKGAKPAREAVRWLLDRSASPYESVLALMTTLPCSMGGYGFSDVELNPDKEVSPEKRHLTRFDVFHPDVFIRRLDTDLEYESDEHHGSPRDVARDKLRRNDIQALGIEVKDVTSDMISHLDSLDLLFEQLLDKELRMGMGNRGRHRSAVRDPDNKAARRVRLHELLPPWPYEQ